MKKRDKIKFVNVRDHDVLFVITPKKERIYFKKPKDGTHPDIINDQDYTYPLALFYPCSIVITKHNMITFHVEESEFYMYVFKYPIDWNNYNKKKDLIFTIPPHETEYYFNDFTFVEQYRPEDFEDDDENKIGYCF